MLGIDTYDVYGLSEFAGLGVACDCECHKGLHVQEDFFVPEVLGMDSNIAVKDGEKESWSSQRCARRECLL